MRAGYHHLAITDRMYSSWSLRGWLSFVQFNIPVDVSHYPLDTPRFETMKKEFAPSRLVPAVQFDDNSKTICWDSLAIVEELNDRYKDATFWPDKDLSARAFCRSMVAEMHSGYASIRGECPMNLQYVYDNFEPSEGVLNDCARIESLWAMAKNQYGTAGPWLFGEQYTAADVFFAPIAMRFVTYNLPRSPDSDAYIQAHLRDPHVRQWRAMAFCHFKKIERAEYPELSTSPWPGPASSSWVATRTTSSVEASVNKRCPYSNDPVTHGLELNNVVYGFCNEFCRDKTFYDPEAWPEFVDLVKETMNTL